MKKRGKGYASIYFGMGNTAKPNPSSREHAVISRVWMQKSS